MTFGGSLLCSKSWLIHIVLLLGICEPKMHMHLKCFNQCLTHNKHEINIGCIIWSVKAGYWKAPGGNLHCDREDMGGKSALFSQHIGSDLVLTHREALPEAAKLPPVTADLHGLWVPHSSSILVSHIYCKISQWEGGRPFYSDATNENLPLPIPTHPPRWSDERPSPLTSQQVWGKSWQNGFTFGIFLLMPKCQCLWASDLHPIPMSKEHLMCTHIPVFHCSLKAQKFLLSLASGWGTGHHIKEELSESVPCETGVLVLSTSSPDSQSFQERWSLHRTSYTPSLHHGNPVCFPDNQQGSHKSSSAYS